MYFTVLQFILRKTIVFKGFRGVPSFYKGVELFSGVGLKMLISIETYRTYFSRERGGGGGAGPDPITPLDRHMDFSEFEDMLLAPLNYF